MDETSILAMTVSATAIKVVHCDSVSGSPSGGDGRGASRGAMRLSCVVVIVARVQCSVMCAAGYGKDHSPGIQGTSHYMGRLFQPADIPLGLCTPNWSARTLGGGTCLVVLFRRCAKAGVNLGNNCSSMWPFLFSRDIKPIWGPSEMIEHSHFIIIQLTKDSFIVGR